MRKKTTESDELLRSTITFRATTKQQKEIKSIARSRNVSVSSLLNRILTESLGLSPSRCAPRKSIKQTDRQPTTKTTRRFRNDIIQKSDGVVGIVDIAHTFGLTPTRIRQIQREFKSLDAIGVPLSNNIGKATIETIG